METQNWPIRSKIIALVAVPIAALLALWIFATTLTVGPASSLLAARTMLDEIGRPGEALVVELQQERRLSVIYLAHRGNGNALGDQRSRTDRAMAEFRRRTSSGDLRKETDDFLDARLDQLLTAVDAVPSGRDFIDRRAVDATGALGFYSGVIDAAFRTFSALNTLPDDALHREARSLTDLGRAREVLAQADALLAGAFAAGRFGPGEHSQLVQIVGTHRFLYAAVVSELADDDRAEYQRLTEGDSFVRLRGLEDELVGRGRAGAAPPIDARAWQNSYDLVQRQLRDFELAGAESLTERSRPVAVGILVRLGLAGIVGFLAVLLSGIIALRIGRSLVRRLTGLRAAALEMAGERLPDVVGRLRKGEDVDVARETPPLDYGGDEIGQVGQAFSEVQRTAVSSAIDEAALRRGLREVFLNIARRSQTLLHRQLALLDRMERRTTEPDELADLFRLDHLATRMRRHAEDLVVLAGAAPGRGWRNPVPMVDVIRGAISEVENYARVDLVNVAPAATAGRAVGDVIHLLAELIENATSFSPPQTRVQVSGQVVPNGYAIEIEDRGLGMTAEAIEEANRRLADPPDFDPANSARLGLFVVAQLGARHGVQVRLRPSPYGGVTAVALVPGELVTSGTGVLALPSGRSDPPGRDGDPPADPALDAAAAPSGGADSAPPDESGTGAVPGSRRRTVLPGSRRSGALGPRRSAGAALAALRDATGRTGAGTPGTVEGTVVEPAGGGAAPAAAGAAAADRTAAGPAGAADPGPAGMADDTVVFPAIRPDGPAEPAEQAEPAEPDRPGGPVRPAAAPIGEDGLPRRIRQTSLAPQLRGGPGPTRALGDRAAGDSAAQGHPGGADTEPADDPAPRSPEQVRAVMAALQTGTARGRRDAGPAPAPASFGAPPPGAGPPPVGPAEGGASPVGPAEGGASPVGPAEGGAPPVGTPAAGPGPSGASAAEAERVGDPQSTDSGRDG